MLKTSLTLLLALPLLAPSIANADDETWAVTGTMPFVGYDVCTPAPCSETVNFSFDVYYVPTGLPGNEAYEAYWSNLTASGSGSLGSFTYSDLLGYHVDYPSSAYPAACTGGEGNFIDFPDPSGDDFELRLCNGLVPEPMAPSLTVGDLYSCATTICQDEFRYGGSGGEVILAGVTVTATPEPAMVGSLLVELLASFLLCCSLGMKAVR